MQQVRFGLILGAALLAAYASFWSWLAPGDRSKLQHDEVERYLAHVQDQMPLPAADGQRFLARLRAWADADDGRPVYMLNLMSYYPELRAVPGTPGVRMTPVAANAHYEQAVTPLLARAGGFPLFAGDTAGTPGVNGTGADLVGAPGSSAIDGIDRVLVVRYPNRRAFLQLVTDPEYLRYAPYKFAALQLALVPLAPQTVLPDPRWLVAFAFVAIWLAAQWWYSRRATDTLD